MSFKFACPHCGQRIGAADEDAGTLGSCPSCGREFLVPSPEPPRHTFLTPREPIQAPPWQDVVRLKKEEEEAVVKPPRALSIFALLLSVLPVLNIVGLVLGILAVVRSDKEGRQGGRGLAVCALVLCGVLFIPVNVVGYFAAGPVLHIHVPGMVEFKPVKNLPNFVPSGEAPQSAQTQPMAKSPLNPTATSKIVDSKPATTENTVDINPGADLGVGTQKAAAPSATGPSANSAATQK
jgi:hypothetical protein